MEYSRDVLEKAREGFQRSISIFTKIIFQAIYNSVPTAFIGGKKDRHEIPDYTHTSTIHKSLESNAMIISVW